MAKYKLAVPAEVFQRLMDDAIKVSRDKSLPDFPQFVDHLMKEMPTEADELHHACTGIAGEAGELLDLSKKVWANNKPLDLTHLIEELGDLRFYYQALLNMVGITDEEVRAQNMLKLSKRYASGHYSDAQAHAQADKKPGADRKFMGMPDPPNVGGYFTPTPPLPVNEKGEVDITAALAAGATVHVYGGGGSGGSRAPATGGNGKPDNIHDLMDSNSKAQP